jgi:hypothetical protein
MQGKAEMETFAENSGFGDLKEGSELKCWWIQ